jgi:hypothetical protein
MRLREIEMRKTAFGVGAGLYLAGPISVIASLATIGLQSIVWLHSGDWPPWQFRLAWRWIGLVEPDVPQWRGVQKILVWLLDQPLGWGLFISGLASMIVGAVIVLMADLPAPATKNVSNFNISENAEC